MSRVSDDPRTYLREAVALADRVMRRPGDEDAAIKLAAKVDALAEALEHGAYKLVRRTAATPARRGRRSRS
ncbi:MAG TPA: hypothetical protein VLE97_05865 [Gaiellaceae bacterium]|nr:hypothetical protein [Gaiellaceae bacterium]